MRSIEIATRGSLAANLAQTLNKLHQKNAKRNHFKTPKPVKKSYVDQANNAKSTKPRKTSSLRELLALRFGQISIKLLINLLKASKKTSKIA